MTSSKALLSAASFALGAWALYKTQDVTKEMFPPILEACSSNRYETMEAFVFQTGYQPFDQRVGFKVFNPLVCLLTQFFYELVQEHPEGFIAWGTTLLCFPAFITLYLEAGRPGSRGLLQYPTFMWLLFQIFGASVVWPTLFVPAYAYHSATGGSVSLFRARAVFMISLVMPVFTVLVFGVLEPNTPAWTTSAGILGGPMCCIAGLWLAMEEEPLVGSVSKQDAIKSAEICAWAYAAAGVVALLGYFYIGYTALQYYSGYGWKELYHVFWVDAKTSVQFMVIDAVVLWLGVVLHIGTRSPRKMVEAIVCTPFFGPGAATAMALASLELEAAPQWTKEDDKKKKKES